MTENMEAPKGSVKWVYSPPIGKGELGKVYFASPLPCPHLLAIDPEVVCVLPSPTLDVCYRK